MSDFISGFFSWGKSKEKIEEKPIKKPNKFDPLSIKKEEEE